MRRRSILVLALLAAAPVSHADELLTPVAATSSTAADDLYPVANLINESGLSDPATLFNYQSVTHDTANASRAWVTKAPGGAGSDYFATGSPAPVLTLDLGGTFHLSALVVWGYHFIAPNNNEAQSITIEFSTDGGATWPESTDVHHDRTSAESETLTFPSPFAADTVRLTITDNHFGTAGAAGGDRVGLGEVKFLATVPPNPNPVIDLAQIVDFGNLPPGSPAQMKSVTISNLGSEQVLEVSAPAPAAPFSVSGSPLVIPPGEVRELGFTFDPQGVPGCYQSPLVLATNDPEKPTVPLHLLGSLACTLAPPAQPGLSPPEGTFTTPFEVTLTTPQVDAVLVYTTDGSPPGPDNGLLYTGPISVASSIQIRAAALRPGLASKPQTKSYLRLSGGLESYTSPLPLVFIDNFARGTIPDKGWTVFHQTGAGLQQVARQPAFLHLVARDPHTGTATALGPPDLTERIGIRVRGAFSSTWYPKPYSVETWDEFDHDKTTTPLGMPGESDWILYYPHPVYDRTLLSNTFTWELSRQTGRYGTRFRFVDVFINEDGGDLTLADRRGVYAFAEKVKRDDDRLEFEPLSADGATGGWLLSVNRMDPAPVGGFPTANGAASPQFFHTAGPDRILQTPPNTAGSGDDLPRQYNAFLNFEHPGGYEINSAQRSTIENWFAAFEDVFYDDALWLDPVNGYRKSLDTRDFIDYFHLLNLAKQGDGLLISIFPWVSSGERKLRMGPMWDFNNGAYQGSTDTFPFFRSERLWYPRLLQDPAYLREHIDRWYELRRGPLSIANMHAIIDAQAAEITSALAVAQGVSSAATWTSHLDAMKTYLADRARWLDDQFFAPPTFSHPGGVVSAQFTLGITNATGTSGTIFFTTDGSDPIHGGGNAYTGPLAFNATAQVKARIQAADGEWSALNEGSYVTGTPPGPGDLVISEIMYHPDENPAEEFLEILNINPTESLDLALVRFAAGVEFTFPVGTILPPGERLLLVRDHAAFEARHGSGLPIAGEFELAGALDDSGDRIILHDANGSTLLDFRYNDRHPWPESADGGGDSLVLIDPTSNPDHRDAASWRSSVVQHGTPGTTDTVTFVGDVHADQDRDGITAWFEHALGTSDQVRDNFSEVFTWTSHPDEGTTIRVTRNLAAEDVVLTLQQSGDLQNWQDVPISPSLESHLARGRATILWHLASPQPTSQFFRLQLAGP